LIPNFVRNMKATIIDIETAFLHGNLDEEIYMEVPPGLDVNKIQNSILHKTIHGLVQSAREFHKTLTEVLNDSDFIGSKSDPSLWTKWDPNIENVIVIGIYVKNCLVIRDQRSISKLIEELRNYELKLKLKKS
jgi:hypothetical protein